MVIRRWIACVFIVLSSVSAVQWIFILRQRSLEFFIKKFAEMVGKKASLWRTSSYITFKLFKTTGKQNWKWDRLNWMVSNSANLPTYSFITSVARAFCSSYAWIKLLPSFVNFRYLINFQRHLYFDGSTI